MGPHLAGRLPTCSLVWRIMVLDSMYSRGTAEDLLYMLPVKAVFTWARKKLLMLKGDMRSTANCPSRSVMSLPTGVPLQHHLQARKAPLQAAGCDETALDAGRWACHQLPGARKLAAGQRRWCLNRIICTTDDRKVLAEVRLRCTVARDAVAQPQIAGTCGRQRVATTARHSAYTSAAA